MSIWADLQDRCSGEVIRKEDDVNHLSPEEFTEYIIKQYDDVSPDKKYVSLTSYICIEHFVKYIKVPIFNTKHMDMLYMFIFIIYHSDDKLVVDFSGKLPNNEDENYSRLIELLKKKFLIDIHNNTNGHTYNCEISPKDGSKVINQFFLDVIDYLIENCDKNQVVIKKK